jgi:plasmid stabilization system protein ParE
VNLFILSPSAGSDIEEIFDFVSKDNPDAAIKWATALQAKFEFLTSHPNVGRPFPAVGDTKGAVKLPLAIQEHLAKGTRTGVAGSRGTPVMSLVATKGLARSTRPPLPSIVNCPLSIAPPFL